MGCDGVRVGDGFGLAHGDGFGLAHGDEFGLELEPSPNIVDGGPHVPMPATLMAQVHVELAHLAISFLNKF